MRRLALIGFALVVVWLGEPGAAAAATVSFADLSVPGTGAASFGATVLHDGFVFSSNMPFGPPGLSIWKNDDVGHPAGGAPATSLFEYTAGSTTTMTRADGGTFGLNAIDLTQWGVGLASFPPTFTVTFTGLRADATTIQQTFTVANFVGAPQLQTFSFTNFSDLVSVRMTQGIYQAGTAFQFTNLVYVTGPSVLCDTQTDHPTYVNGDQVRVTALRFANLTPDPVASEIKVWLGTPAGDVSIINAGSTGSATLPPGLDVNLGPFTLFPVTPALPRGGYEFSCRLLNPTTGELLATKRSSFVIH